MGSGVGDPKDMTAAALGGAEGHVPTTPKEVLDGLKADLDRVLKDLGHEGEATKLLAAKVADLAVQTFSMKMLGQDTRVAEQALKAATQNLIAATNTTVANSTLQLVQSTVVKVLRGLISTVLVGL